MARRHDDRRKALLGFVRVEAKDADGRDIEPTSGSPGECRR